MLKYLTRWVKLVFDEEFSSVRVIFVRKSYREQEKIVLKTVLNIRHFEFFKIVNFEKYREVIHEKSN